MTENDKHKYLVGKFVRPPVNWPANLKMAKKIYNEYPEIEFWESLEEKKYASLAFFLCEDGIDFLAAQYKKFNNQTNSEINIEEKPVIKIYNQKFGENKPQIKKIKTLEEFLKK